MKKTVQRSRRTPGTRTGDRKGAATTKTTRSKRRDMEKTSPEQTLTRMKQSSLYEKAMKLFHAGDFAKAKSIFDEAVTGPNREMAHSARVHRTVCERRLARTEMDLPTPDDHYDYAVTLINRRELDQARQHLEQALERIKDGDHVHYALALCHGLKGDVENATAHLKRAIEIQPRNRTAARNDPDFQAFAGQPQVRALLYPERTGPG